MGVELAEADYSIREDRSPLGALIVAKGGFRGNVTVELTPMTVTEYMKQGLTSSFLDLSNDLGNLDHAEAGERAPLDQ